MDTVFGKKSSNFTESKTHFENYLNEPITTGVNDKIQGFFPHFFIERFHDRDSPVEMFSKKPKSEFTQNLEIL